MNTENWQCEVRDQLARFDKDITIYRVTRDRNGIEVMGADGISRIVERGTEKIQPTLSISDDAFQALVDTLKNRKPTEAKYTEGKLEATERHLQDMRQILKLK